MKQDELKIKQFLAQRHGKSVFPALWILGTGKKPKKREMVIYFNEWQRHNEKHNPFIEKEIK